ncbi:VOC family protein [Candidatus Nephthysia bennettiae]|uniref:VOC family protein n=1 Tax=Candidatus Nephthysia bennettiae TaxID=3127016 RepID=A0A934NBU9_9BACT|nr:VOC family protein [Candidatus Dormibacteraeota bacterium]MBJ7611936.1 VOC family protein [Candidatus Dormibacteraeota bacterium]
MANPVNHFEVTGTDGPKLQRFYREVFAWTINADNPMGYGMVSPSEGGIGGGISGGGEGGQAGRGVTFYVEVANLEQTLDAVQAAGGKTVMPPGNAPGGPRLAQFEDPEGNRIGLTQAGTMQQPG